MISKLGASALQSLLNTQNLMLNIHRFSFLKRLIEPIEFYIEYSGVPLEGHLKNQGYSEPKNILYRVFYFKKGAQKLEL